MVCHIWSLLVVCLISASLGTADSVDNKALIDILKARLDKLENKVEQIHPTVDCLMGPWSPWGMCSSSCNGGNATRRRTVITQPQHGGLSCPITLTETKECNKQPCPVNCLMGSWGRFDPCSRSCNGGNRTRHRKVIKQPQNGGWCSKTLMETRECNTHLCPHPGNGGWCSWREVELSSCIWPTSADKKSILNDDEYDGGFDPITNTWGLNKRYVRLCDCPAPSSGGGFCIGPDIREIGGCCEGHGSGTEDWNVDKQWKSHGGAAVGLNCQSLKRRKRDVGVKPVEKEDLQKIIKRVDMKSIAQASNTKKMDSLKPNQLQAAFEYGKKIFEGQKKISAKDICNLHEILTDKEVKANPGMNRSNSVIIVVNDEMIDFPPASKVLSLLDDFLIWLNTENGIHPIIKAAQAFFKLANIHPFRNGNGRTSRLVMNLMLTRAGYLPVALPRSLGPEYNSLLASYMATRDPENLKEPSPQDMQPFVSFIAGRLEAALDREAENADYQDMHKDKGGGGGLV